MPRRKIIGYAAGLAGSAAIAWGLYGLLVVDSCDPSPCPTDPDQSVLALTIGLIVTVGAVFAAGPRLYPLPFLAVAIGAGVAGVQYPDLRGVGLGLAAGFGAPALLPLALIPIARRKRQRAERLVTQGKTAIGTVTEFRDTGVTVNQNPRVELTLRIEPEDGSLAFEGKKTITVSRVDLPYRGQTFPVWYDPADRATFGLGAKMDADAPPAVRRLFAKAAAADPGRPAGTAAGDGGADAAADPLDRLAKLNELRLSGALTPAEFEREKAKLLNSS